jgi:hypothetical protein
MLAGPLAAALFAEPAHAHGLELIGRRDLPIPEWLFAWAAAIVLIVSFALLTLAWRQPRLEDDGWRPAPKGFSSALVNPVTRFLAGLASVLLLGGTVYVGLEGTEAPNQNFSVTFIFVTFWLGMVLLSVLLGDVFRVLNPWGAIARTASRGFRLVAGQDAPAQLRYPEWLGRWPAVLGILCFVWLELIYGAGGLTIGLQPETLAIAVLVYSAVTFTAMALFGIEEWLERGEAFSGYFGMFARLAPLEVRDGRLGVRKPLAAAGAGWARVPGSWALVVTAIGLTAFDGAQEGALSGTVNWGFERLVDLGLGQVLAYRVTATIIMLACVCAVALIFMAGVRGMHTVRNSPPTSELVRSFAHTLIPIALAYVVAHYFTLFLFQEQAQFTYLLSDPLGEGSDLFGTASGGIDYGLIGATAVWYVQVGTLVVGHVLGLTMAHDRAIALYGDSRLAARSQYFMLAVMVAFTCLGLFLLSQSNA